MATEQRLLLIELLRQSSEMMECAIKVAYTNTMVLNTIILDGESAAAAFTARTQRATNYAIAAVNEQRDRYLRAVAVFTTRVQSAHYAIAAVARWRGHESAVYHKQIDTTCI